MWTKSSLGCSNTRRPGELKHYEAIRHYQVQYKGFAIPIAAKMDVQVDFDDASGKSFRIVSQSGSSCCAIRCSSGHWRARKEASQDKEIDGIDSCKYRFQAGAGSEVLDRAADYILQVDPLHDSKFLYRGKV